MLKCFSSLQTSVLLSLPSLVNHTAFSSSLYITVYVVSHMQSQWKLALQIKWCNMALTL